MRTSLHRLPQCLDGSYDQPALPILLCHCFCQTIIGGTGISTSCPSPTAVALGLGPDLPWEDEPSPGNLRLSTIKILTSFSLLIPAFSLAVRPPSLSVRLQPTTRCSSTPDRNSLILLFGAQFAFDLISLRLMLRLMKCPLCLRYISELRSRHAFGVQFSPGHFRRITTRPVSYYALFE